MENRTLQDIVEDVSFFEETCSMDWESFRYRIESMAQQFHSMAHIRPDLSPNENTIYIVWNDFEITDEKGGPVFGQRSVRTSYPSLFFTTVFRFPFQRSMYTGAIMSYEECRLFRSWMSRVWTQRSTKKENAHLP